MSFCFLSILLHSSRPLPPFLSHLSFPPFSPLLCSTLPSSYSSLPWLRALVAKKWMSGALGRAVCHMTSAGSHGDAPSRFTICLLARMWAKEDCQWRRERARLAKNIRGGSVESEEAVQTSSGRMGQEGLLFPAGGKSRVWLKVTGQELRWFYWI